MHGNGRLQGEATPVWDESCRIEMHGIKPTLILLLLRTLRSTAIAYIGVVEATHTFQPHSATKYHASTSQLLFYSSK